VFIGFKLSAQQNCLKAAKAIYKVDSAISLLKSCLPQLKVDTAVYVETTCYLSKLYNRAGKLEQSKKLLNALKADFKNSLSPSLNGLISIHLGNTFHATHLTDDALAQYLQALKLFESARDLENQVGVYTNLAEFYRSMGEYAKAKTYIIKGLQLYSANNLNSAQKLIKLYNRYAAIENENARLDTSIHYTLKALQLSIISKDKYNEATSWNELGYSLKNKSLTDSSYKSYQKAIDIWKSIGAQTEAVHAMFNQVQLLSHIGENHKKLIPYYHNIIDFVKENNIEYWLNEAYYELASCYFFTGDSINMYKYRNQSASEMIRKMRTQYNAQVNDIQEKYENEKYKNEIREVSEALEETKQDLTLIKKENLLIYSLLIIISASLVIIYFLWKRINNANKELKVKNIEKDSLIQEIHHRVKNNLQFVSSLINMQIGSSKNADEKETLKEVSRRIKSMALVHQMLYNREDLEGVDIKAYIGELINSIEELVNSKGISIKFNLSCDDLKFKTTQAIAVGIIVSELISNSIKHAFVNTNEPAITIGLKHSNKNEMVLQYQDNGCGIKNFNKQSKDNLGMRLIDIFSRQLKGAYEFVNENGLLFSLKFKNESSD
jgi:two-component system, sensor histidine kinase PdtaS